MLDARLVARARAAGNGCFWGMAGTAWTLRPPRPARHSQYHGAAAFWRVSRVQAAAAKTINPNVANEYVLYGVVP